MLWFNFSVRGRVSEKWMETEIKKEEVRMENGEGDEQGERKRALKDDGRKTQNKTSFVKHTHCSLHIV